MRTAKQSWLPKESTLRLYTIEHLKDNVGIQIQHLKRVTYKIYKGVPVTDAQLLHWESSRQISLANIKLLKQIIKHKELQRRLHGIINVQ